MAFFRVSTVLASSLREAFTAANEPTGKALANSERNCCRAALIAQILADVVVILPDKREIALSVRSA